MSNKPILAINVEPGPLPLVQALDHVAEAVRLLTAAPPEMLRGELRFQTELLRDQLPKLADLLRERLGLPLPATAPAVIDDVPRG